MLPETLQYPIGRFSAKASYTTEEITDCIARIERFPELLEAVYAQLNPHRLEYQYRPDGWTARQVLHHLADSHMNAYIRCKWALTEDTPIIKSYNEKAWAETPETVLDPGLSVNLLKALHRKWAALLRSIPPEKLQQSFVHPETTKQVRLSDLISLYAWHGEHHLAHLRLVLSKTDTPSI